MRILLALLLTAVPAVADLTFDRYHSYDETTAYLQAVAERHPGLVRLESAGRSVEGRELWVATVTDFSTGEPATKPGIYVDGGHHGNEVASAEVPLHLLKFLVENRARFEVVRHLLATRVFYILPRVNPDACEWYRRGVEVRGNLRPADDDGDGAVDEDGPDDVDGDGLVLQMAVPDPGGDFVLDEATGRPRERRRGESGQRWRIQREGTDEDGDGRIDEDGPNEGEDLNRDYPDPIDVFASHAQPRLGQPESRAVEAFLRARPNIGNVQSFHTFGGILFRPFGGVPDSYIPAADLEIYDRMGRNFTRYTGDKPYGRPYGPMGNIRGALIDYAYGALGAYAVTAELWRVPGEDPRLTRSWAGGLEGIVGPQADRAWREFNETELGGSAYVEWRAARHPSLGEVRIGGWSPWFKRNPPRRYLQEVCSKATLFSLYQALMTARVVAGPVVLEAGSRDAGEVVRLSIRLTNEGVFPTTTHLARQLGRFDPIVVEVVDGTDCLAKGEVVALDGEESRDLVLTLPRRPSPDARLVVRSTKGGTSTARIE